MCSESMDGEPQHRVDLTTMYCFTCPQPYCIFNLQCTKHFAEFLVLFDCLAFTIVKFDYVINLYCRLLGGVKHCRASWMSTASEPPPLGGSEV
jgi:hypothetical protein